MERTPLGIVDREHSAGGEALKRAAEDSAHSQGPVLSPRPDGGAWHVGPLGLDLSHEGEMVGVVGHWRNQVEPERDEVGLELDDLAQMPVDDGDLSVGGCGGAVLDDRHEQPGLVAEVVVDRPGGHAGLGGDRVDARPRVAVPGEPPERARQDRLPLVHEPPCPYNDRCILYNDRCTLARGSTKEERPNDTHRHHHRQHRPGRRAHAVGEWVAAIAERHLAAAGSHATIEVVDLADHELPLLDERAPAIFGAYEHPHTRRWAAVIERFDGFVFVTPEYNHSVPAALKNAIDFLYAEWNDKAAAFVSYGVTGGTRAVEHLRAILAEVKVAGVRTQVALSLFADLEASGDPAAPNVVVQGNEHESTVAEMLDELLAWSGALQALRTSGATTDAAA